MKVLEMKRMQSQKLEATHLVIIQGEGKIYVVTFYVKFQTGILKTLPLLHPHQHTPFDSLEQSAKLLDTIKDMQG